MADVILPGTYITVRDAGLISVGGVISGAIGIVGTAEKGPTNKVQILGSLTEAKEIFGKSGPWKGLDSWTLIRALELVYSNGGRTVYAVRTVGREAAKASYGVTADGDNNPSVQLEASEGAWGNAIRIKISADGPEDSPKKVELTYEETSETYAVANAGALVNAVNTRSTLVSASLSQNQYEAVPENTEGPGSVAFTGGDDGVGPDPERYKTSLAKLENEIVNIVVLAGQDVSSPGMVLALQAHLNTTAANKRERIGLIGSNGTDDVNEISQHGLRLNSDRLIFTAPGIKTTDIDSKTRQTSEVTLPGGYLAAAVAGRIASLPVQTSPTNKTLALGGLSTEFTSSQLENLVPKGVLAVEKREGFRIVKGITTATNSAWQQITTRRIVDYAIYGVRAACNPYIGKLNNERVRGAMKATLDAFLTRMVDNEALVDYQLDVSATRAQEIAGRAIVTMSINPTFSIDYVMVTMSLD